MMGTRDASCCLTMPVDASCPVIEETSYGCVCIVVTADDEYFSSYVANLEVMLEVDEEALELIFTKQFLYPCIVGILHFVTIRGVEQVDDDEFGRVCLERITQELQYLVKSHFCGHDAMISVDVVLIDSRT